MIVQSRTPIYLTMGNPGSIPGHGNQLIQSKVLTFDEKQIDDG